jgi:hypothetical protein
VVVVAIVVVAVGGVLVAVAVDVFPVGSARPAMPNWPIDFGRRQRAARSAPLHSVQPEEVPAADWTFLGGSQRNVSTRAQNCAGEPSPPPRESHKHKQAIDRSIDRPCRPTGRRAAATGPASRSSSCCLAPAAAVVSAPRARPQKTIFRKLFSMVAIILFNDNQFSLLLHLMFVVAVRLARGARPVARAPSFPRSGPITCRKRCK